MFYVHLKLAWAKSQASLQAIGDTILVLTFSRGKVTRQHLSKGCAASQKAAQHRLCSSSIYYKPWKLQLLSVVATSGFDTSMQCKMQYCSRKITQIHLALISLINLPAEDLIKPPVWLSTSELRDFKLFMVKFLLSQNHNRLHGSGGEERGIIKNDGKPCKPFPSEYIAESSACRYCTWPGMKLYIH